MLNKYKLSDDYTHFHYISPHDRLYRDCLKDVQWEQEYKPNLLHGLAFIACLFLLTLLLLSLSN